MTNWLKLATQKLTQTLHLNSGWASEKYSEFCMIFGTFAALNLKTLWFYDRFPPKKCAKLQIIFTCASASDNIFEFYFFSSVFAFNHFICPNLWTHHTERTHQMLDSYSIRILFVTNVHCAVGTIGFWLMCKMSLKKRCFLCVAVGSTCLLFLRMEEKTTNDIRSTHNFCRWCFFIVLLSLSTLWMRQLCLLNSKKNRVKRL